MVCGFGPIGMVPLGYEFCTSKAPVEEKMDKFQEKVKNKAKHGAATAATTSLTIAGAAAVLGHEEKKAIVDSAKLATKTADKFIKDTPKVSEDLLNAVKNKDFKGFKYASDNIKNATKSTAKEVGKFIKTKPIDLATKFETIKTGKGFIDKAKQKGSQIYNIVKKSLTFGSKKLGAMFDTVSNSLKTLPKNQKVALGILGAGLVAIGLINNHSSYKNGKIDQKYEQKNEPV